MATIINKIISSKQIWDDYNNGLLNVKDIKNKFVLHYIYNDILNKYKKDGIYSLDYRKFSKDSLVRSLLSNENSPYNKILDVTTYTFLYKDFGRFMMNYELLNIIVNTHNNPEVLHRIKIEILNNYYFLNYDEKSRLLNIIQNKLNNLLSYCERDSGVDFGIYDDYGNLINDSLLLIEPIEEIKDEYKLNLYDKYLFTRCINMNKNNDKFNDLFNVYVMYYVETKYRTDLLGTEEIKEKSYKDIYIDSVFIVYNKSIKLFEEEIVNFYNKHNKIIEKENKDGNLKKEMVLLPIKLTEFMNKKFGFFREYSNGAVTDLGQGDPILGIEILNDLNYKLFGVKNICFNNKKLKEELNFLI